MPGGHARRETEDEEELDDHLWAGTRGRGGREPAKGDHQETDRSEERPRKRMEPKRTSAMVQGNDTLADVPKNART